MAAEAPEALAKCHFFNSFFYKRLLQTMGKKPGGGNDADRREAYQLVRRWTKNADLFNKDFIFVPINESLHWSLAIICRVRPHADPSPHPYIYIYVIYVYTHPHIHTNAAAPFSNTATPSVASQPGAYVEQRARQQQQQQPLASPARAPVSANNDGDTELDDDDDDDRGEELARRRQVWAPDSDDEAAGRSREDAPGGDSLGLAAAYGSGEEASGGEEVPGSGEEASGSGGGEVASLGDEAVHGCSGEGGGEASSSGASGHDRASGDADDEPLHEKAKRLSLLSAGVSSRWELESQPEPERESSGPASGALADDSETEENDPEGGDEAEPRIGCEGGGRIGGATYVDLDDGETKRDRHGDEYSANVFEDDFAQAPRKVPKVHQFSRQPPQQQQQQGIRARSSRQGEGSSGAVDLTEGSSPGARRKTRAKGSAAADQIVDISDDEPKPSPARQSELSFGRERRAEPPAPKPPPPRVREERSKRAAAPSKSGATAADSFALDDDDDDDDGPAPKRLAAARAAASSKSVAGASAADSFALNDDDDDDDGPAAKRLAAAAAAEKRAGSGKRKLGGAGGASTATAGAASPWYATAAPASAAGTSLEEGIELDGSEEQAPEWQGAQAPEVASRSADPNDESDAEASYQALKRKARGSTRDEDEDPAPPPPPPEERSQTLPPPTPPRRAPPAPPPNEGRVPCILYIDSLGGSRTTGINLLKFYLDEEWKDKARDANASTKGLEDPKFRQIPVKTVRVPHQHNHSDCGLYMLKYIERFARLGTELEPPLEGMREPKWVSYPELRFAKEDIITMRRQMHEIITTLGKGKKY